MMPHALLPRRGLPGHRGFRVPGCRRRRHAFGSWRAALAAAGIVAPPVPTAQRKWDRQCVTAAIQERQQAGKSLRYSAVRAEAGGLVAAAKTYLGSWTKAPAAAGVKLTLSWIAP
jgi:hypothetical protein